MKKAKAAVKGDGLRWHEPKKVQIADMQFAPYNPRRMPAAKMRQLKASLLKHGVVLNLVVQRHSEAHGENVMIGGHQRIIGAREICRERNWPEPDHGWAVILDVPDAVAKQLNVALNNIGGEFDPHMLGLLLADVSAAGEVDFDAIGLAEDNVTELIRSATKSPEEMAAELEREAGSLLDGFAPTHILTIEFASAEDRNRAKVALSDRAKAEGAKGGSILLKLLAAVEKKVKKNEQLRSQA